MYNKNLAVFDFDNTITTKDTLIDFLRFFVGGFKLSWGLFKCSPFIVFYKLKILSNQKAKEFLLTHFFYNLPERELIKFGKEYSDNRLHKILNHEAISRIHFHHKRNDKLVIVSASPTYWFREWCIRQGFTTVIGTQLEKKDGKMTGKIIGKNCFGDEKLRRLKQELPLEDYQHIYAYGDGKGDLALLNFASESYIKFKRFK